MRTRSESLLLAASVALPIALAAAAAPGRAEAAERRDPAAVALAEKERAAHGGASWEAARFFRFEFNVEFPGRKSGPIAHAWDRYTGRYRVDVPGENGFTAWFDVNAPKDLSKAVIKKNGARVTGEDAAKLLERAYGRFVNDSYWLLAPLKMLDPGVNVDAAPDAEFDGKTAKVIRLSFEGVGLTPGDVYWHFLDPETHAMLGWEYQLQKTEPPPTRWRWTDVKDFAGLKLSLTKVSPDGTRKIFFTNVSVSKDVDLAVLTPPSE